MRAALGAILGVAVAATAARADPEAKRLFDEGRKLLDRGKTAEACKRFEESHARERAGGTMLNLAECAERAGDLVRAWVLYDDAAREYERTNKPAAQRFARERAQALEAKLATVVVRVTAPETDGLVLRIGDDELAPTAVVTRRYEPGPLTVTARAPGRARFQAKVKAVAGREVTVRVPALALRARDGEAREPTAPAVEPAAEPAAEPLAEPARGRSDDAPAASEGRGWRIAFWTSLGLGAVSAGAWYYGFREVSAASDALCVPGTGTSPDCERRQLSLEASDRYNLQGERGQAIAIYGAVGTAVGITAAAVSLYFGYLRDPDPVPSAGPARNFRTRTRTARQARILVGPTAAPSSIGLSLSGGF